MSKQILVPVDGSKPSMNALKHAIKLAKAFDAEIVVSSIIVPYDLSKMLDEQDEGRLSSIGQIPNPKDSSKGHVVKPESSFPLEAAKKVAEKEHFENITFREIVDYDPATRILNQAKSLKSDMIIIGNRGLGAFAKLLLGSVSSKIAQYAKCPVVIVK